MQGKGETKGDSKGESKGKGKSGFQGSCWICGEFGHSQNNCPKGKGKGMSKGGWYGGWNSGKGSWGGKGKGIHLADYWPADGWGSAQTTSLGGSVEGVESGVSEFEREDIWTDEIFTGEWTTVETKRKIGRDPVQVDVSKLSSQPKMNRYGKSINSIDKPGVSFTPSEINGVSATAGWEQVSVQVDSGAIDTVAPNNVGSELPVRKTKAANMGLGYVAANGTRIENYGERALKGFTDDGSGVEMAVQVTDVKRTLGSVYRMNQAGNRLVLDGDDSYMVHKATGKVTPIYVEQGKFLFNIWIESKNKKEETDEDEKRKSAKSRNMFAALAEEDEKPTTGFSWRDEIL